MFLSPICWNFVFFFCIDLKTGVLLWCKAQTFFSQWTFVSLTRRSIIPGWKNGMLDKLVSVFTFCHFLPNNSNDLCIVLKWTESFFGVTKQRNFTYLKLDSQNGMRKNLRRNCRTVRSQCNQRRRRFAKIITKSRNRMHNKTDFQQILWTRKRKKGVWIT